SSCREEIQKTIEEPETIAKLPPRLAYEQSFSKNDSLLLQWKEAFEKAKQDDLQITLPYSESGVFSKKNFNVYSYNIQLREGERIVVEVDKQLDSTLVFIDLFRAKTDSLKLYKNLKSAEDNHSKFSEEIEIPGLYKVI